MDLCGPLSYCSGSWLSADFRFSGSEQKEENHYQYDCAQADGKIVEVEWERKGTDLWWGIRLGALRSASHGSIGRTFGGERVRGARARITDAASTRDPIHG